MIRINLSHVHYCDVQHSQTAIDFIPVMQRRRLSQLAKIALNNLIQSKADQPVDYIIWVSQYGDEAKTLNILKDVLQGQTPSPTQFSTSVHNAISGLYSILCHDSTPATSLAGSWSDALIEAYAWLKSSNQPDAKVMVVYYESPLPTVYQESQAFDSFSLAGIVSLQHPNLELQIDMDAPYCFEQAQQFFHFWNHDQQALEGWSKC